MSDKRNDENCIMVKVTPKQFLCTAVSPPEVKDLCSLGTKPMIVIKLQYGLTPQGQPWMDNLMETLMKSCVRIFSGKLRTGFAPALLYLKESGETIRNW